MPILKKSLTAAPRRQVDSYLQIADLFTDPAAPFDVVGANLKGPHGRHVNDKSDRAYFILEGTGFVYVGDEATDAHPMDLIYIPKGTPHGISGHLKFLIITSPPFDSQNEQKGEAIK